MIPIAIQVARREAQPTDWATFVRGLGFASWCRSVALTALESLDESMRRRRQGFEVVRCRPWLRGAR